MYCPKCGKSDQKEDSFCRQCGSYLPDFTAIKKRERSPEDHLKANSFLNLLTAIVSLSLAVTLYAMFLGQEETPFIIYLVAGFLTAMFAWQVQTFWRTQQLKKHFKRRRGVGSGQPEMSAGENIFAPAPTLELLKGADFSQIAPPGVTENTTGRLAKKISRKSS